MKVPNKSLPDLIADIEQAIADEAEEPTPAPTTPENIALIARSEQWLLDMRTHLHYLRILQEQT